MNRSEESNLPGITTVPSISHDAGPFHGFRVGVCWPESPPVQKFERVVNCKPRPTR